MVCVRLALVKTVGSAHHAKICQNLGDRDAKKQCCELRKCLVTDVNLSKGHVCANKIAVHVI